MAANAPRELEALFLRIYANWDEYARAIKPIVNATKAMARDVQTSLQPITKAFDAVGVAATNAANAVKAAATTITSIGPSLNNVAAINTAQLAANLKSLGMALADSRLGLKSVGNAATNIRELSKAFRTLDGLSGGFIATATVGMGDGIISLSKALDKSPLRLTSASTAATNIAEIGKAFRGFPSVNAANLTSMGEGIKNLATSISGAGLARAKFTDSLMAVGLLGDALRTLRLPASLPATLGGLATELPKLFAAMSTARPLTLVAGKKTITAMEELGAALQKLRVPPNIVTNLNTFISSLPSLNIPGLATNIAPLGSALSALGKGLQDSKLGLQGVTKAIPNIQALGPALTSLNTVNAAQAAGTLQALAPVLAPFGVALQASKLGNASFSRIGPNLLSLSQGITAMAAVTPAAAVASVATLTSWLKTLSGINPDQIRNLTKLGNALSQFTAFNAAFSNASNLPPIIQKISNTANVAGGNVNRLSGSMNTLGRSMIGARTSMTLTQLTMAGFAALSVVAFAKFDEAIARMSARMDGFNDSMRESLTRGIMDVAGRTTTPVGHLAPALGILSASGMNQAMAMRALPIAESFATAGGMEMANATRHLTQVLNALGLASADVSQHLAGLTRVSDAFVRSSQLVDVSVQEMSEAFNARFAASLRQANYSLEQGIGLIMAYADAGVRGTDAGNRASIVFQSLEHALVGHMHAWENLGLSILDTNRRMLPIADIIELLERRLVGLNPVQQRAALEYAGFESRVTQALYPLLGFSRAIRENTEAMDGAAGSAERAANIIRRSFGAQITILWNNVKNLAIEIGRILAPAVEWLGEKIRVLVVWFRELNPQLQKLLVWGSVILVTVVPALTLLGTLGGIVAGAWATTIAVFGAVLFAIKVIVLYVGAIALLLAPVGIVLGTVLGLTIDWRTAWDDITLAVGRTVGAVTGFALNFRENMGILSDWFNEENRNNFVNLGNILATVWGNVLHNITAVFRRIGEFISWFAREFPNIARDTWTVISAVFSSVGEAFSVLIDAMKRLWSGFWDSEAANAVKRGLDQIGPAVREWFANLGRAAPPTAEELARRRLGGLAVELPPEARAAVEAGRFSALTESQLRLVNDMANLQLRTGQRPTGADLAGFGAAALTNEQRAAITGVQRQITDMIQMRQFVRDLPATIERGFHAPAGVFRTQPFEPSPLNFRSIFEATQAQTAARAAAIVSLGGAGGLGPVMAGLAGHTPLLALPQFNLGIPSAMRGPDMLLPALAGMTTAGGPISVMANLAMRRLGLVPAMNRVNAPMPGEGGMPPIIPPPTGRGVGFQFAQLAQSRFMVGGDLTRQIEEQHVRDSTIDQHLPNIARILERIESNTDPSNVRRPPGPPSPFSRGPAGHPSDLP